MYFKNQTQEVPEILLNYFKNQVNYLLQKGKKGVSELLSNWFKNKTKGVPEIISNKLLEKPGPNGLQDSFKLLQKQKGFLRFFQITSKPKQKGSPRFFQNTSKTKQKGFLGYFQITAKS